MKRLETSPVVLPLAPVGAIATAVSAPSLSTGSVVPATPASPRVHRAENVMESANSVAVPSSLAAAESLRQGRPQPAMREALAEPVRPLMTVSARLLLKRALYLVAIVLLPGALIAAVLLWWVDRRRIRGSSPRLNDA